MEYLSLQIHQATNLGDWYPFKTKHNNFKISHLFFVDDVLLFAKVTDKSL